LRKLLGIKLARFKISPTFQTIFFANSFLTGIACLIFASQFGCISKIFVKLASISVQMLTPISHPLLQDQAIKLYVYRLDLRHAPIGGNKYFKLNYNLAEATHQKKNTLLTFGGAFSNHIRAVATAGQLHGFKTIGIIRGEETLPLNATLTHAKKCGMYLHYIDRTAYRQKDSPEFITQLEAQFGDFYLLPEGGSNGLAVMGCAEIMDSIAVDWDYATVACGTGGTMAGLLVGNPDKKVLGFPALKGGEFLYDEITRFIRQYNELIPPYSRLTTYDLRLFTAYHFGGYAKHTPELLAFIEQFYVDYHIRLDWIYSAKMLYGVIDLIQQGYFPQGSKIIALHTGNSERVAI
jgi:1-aminocyclopropane-1-carboxylate deaminase/D-cysteine desulfhydrase-like pyridoxal-dependent ACC family enzyme